MEAAQRMVADEGRGVIIWLDQEGKGNGHLALIESIKYKEQLGQAEAYVKAGYVSEARDYRPAAKIIKNLGIASIILLSRSKTKATELEDLGVNVSGSRTLDIRT